MPDALARIGGAVARVTIKDGLNGAVRREFGGITESPLTDAGLDSVEGHLSQQLYKSPDWQHRDIAILGVTIRDERAAHAATQNRLIDATIELCKASLKANQLERATALLLDAKPLLDGGPLADKLDAFLAEDE